mgnify:CR=1 FL=1
MNTDEYTILHHSSYINNYIIDTVKDILYSLLNKEVRLEYNSEYSKTVDAMALQFYYNIETNRCHIEFDFNNVFKKNYSDYVYKVQSILKNIIKIELYDDTTIYPEIVFPEDGVNENCDSMTLLSPYTIGYWKSISGKYEFITDKEKILIDYNNLVFPTDTEEYETKKKAIYDDYMTKMKLGGSRALLQKYDNEFRSKLYNLNVEYNMVPGENGSFRKNFKTFIDIIRDINYEYSQPILSEEDKSNYIDIHSNNLIYYSNTPSLYEKVTKNLNNQFELKDKLNEEIPNIFEIYKEKYREFFEKDLSDFEFIHDDAKFLEDPDDRDHNDDNIEIWTYDGDFDFGDLNGSVNHDTDEIEIWSYDGDFDFGEYDDNGALIVDEDTVALEDYEYNEACDYPEGTVDPDSVAKEDYEYIRAAETIVLRTNYNINIV